MSQINDYSHDAYSWISTKSWPKFYYFLAFLTLFFIKILTQVAKTVGPPLAVCGDLWKIIGWGSDWKRDLSNLEISEIDSAYQMVGPLVGTYWPMVRWMIKRTARRKCLTKFQRGATIERWSNHFMRFGTNPSRGLR